MEKIMNPVDELQKIVDDFPPRRTHLGLIQ